MNSNSSQEFSSVFHQNEKILFPNLEFLIGDLNASVSPLQEMVSCDLYPLEITGIDLDSEDLGCSESLLGNCFSNSEIDYVVSIDQLATGLEQANPITDGFLSSEHSIEKSFQSGFEVAMSKLSTLHINDRFSETMMIAFGDDLGIDRALVLIDEIVSGKTLPKFSVVEQDILSGFGAFGIDTQTIYLSDEFLKNNFSSPETVASVILEELGHFIDDSLKETDSPGDEGAIFAYISQFGSITNNQLSLLKLEDDHDNLIIGTTSISVELSNFKTELNFGESISGLILNSQEDEFLFDININNEDLGKTFSIVLDSDGDLRPTLELLDSNGVVVSTGISGTNVTDTRISSFQIPLSNLDAQGNTLSSTKYTIRVKAFNHQVGAFELGVSELNYGFPEPIEFSSFNVGYLEHPGDLNIHTFEAQANDLVTLAVEGTGFTPDLTLLDSEGNVIAGGGNADTTLTQILNFSGTYQVIVGGSGFAGVGQGSYLLSLSDPRPEAQAIEFGQQLQGDLHVPGDRAIFNLNVGSQEVGKPVSITVSERAYGGNSYYFGAVIEVYGPNGTLLASQGSNVYYQVPEIDDFV
ncbi:MAG: hypothetical protein HC799_19235, partial [Limnothrix sp. RL_2_0]|nr:hypothetical protein [Limnothrix sp. RL_2_0]